jgi:ribonuclease HI
MEPPNTKKGAQ